MAYDPIKAHEYYMNYTKKGLKKGRKKAAAQQKSTAADAVNLGKTQKMPTGSSSGGVKLNAELQKKKDAQAKLSTAGLNESGRNAAANLKYDVQNKRNAAIAKHKAEVKKQVDQLRAQVKGTKDKAQKTALREQIKKLQASSKATMQKIKDDASKEYADGLNKIKNDPKMQSGGTAGLSDEGKRAAADLKAGGKSARTKALNDAKQQHQTTVGKIKAEAAKIKAEKKAAIEKFNTDSKAKIEALQKKMEGMSAADKKSIRAEITKLRADLKAEKASLTKSFSDKYNDCKNQLSKENSSFKTSYKALQESTKKQQQADYDKGMADIRKRYYNK